MFSRRLETFFARLTYIRVIMNKLSRNLSTLLRDSFPCWLWYICTLAGSHLLAVLNILMILQVTHQLHHSVFTV